MSNYVTFGFTGATNLPPAMQDQIGSDAINKLNGTQLIQGNMGFLQNLNIGGGISNVIDSIFGGVSQTIGAASDAAAANPELASAALGAAAGVPIPPPSGAGATSTAGGGTKDQKLFDNVTNQNESAWKWPAIVAGGLVVVLIVWKLLSSKKGGSK